MKFTLPIKVSNLQPDKDLVRWLAQIFDQITTILNGNIDFSTNFKGKIVSVYFNAANVQQGIQHNLGKIPSGYFVVESQSTGSVYDGATAWTNQFIYLQCSTIETKKLLIF